jgi:hypothetical protein
MASLGNTFDATSVDTTQREFENLPEGDYELEVEASEIKDTADNTGKRLALTYRVVSGEFENRKIFGGINIVNKNPQAQEIGQKELASLCRAVGLTSIEDSEELHFKAFHAKLGLSKKRVVGDKTYEPRNEIKKFYFPDEGAPPEAKPAPVAAKAAEPAAAAKPAASGARPWGKK